MGGDEPRVALFAYGSLEFPEIMEMVAGRSFPARAAVLHGYRRRLLRGEVYPGIVPAPGDATPGTLYAGIEAAALVLLDAFEGAPYLRERLPVIDVEGVRVEAFTYVVRPEEAGRLSDALWDRERFRRAHYDDFVRMCRLERGTGETGERS